MKNGHNNSRRVQIKTNTCHQIIELRTLQSRYQLRIPDCKYLWEPLSSHHCSEKKLQARQILEQQLAAVKWNKTQNSIYLK